jgi:hypothetical protein
MGLYTGADYPVAAEIEALPTSELASFTQCGTWGSAAQRAAIAATAREARSAAGLQEAVSDKRDGDTAKLPDAALQLARDVALDGTTIDREYCRQVQAEGVTEGAYVEIVGVVSRLVNLDVFARGIGLAPRPLGETNDSNKPTFERPSEAVDEGFFTASVPSAPEGGALAESLYGKNPAGNIIRTLSLVPEEAHRLIALVTNQYFPAAQLMDLTATGIHALSRAQIEIVATKVSEHNKCFY